MLLMFKLDSIVMLLDRILLLWGTIHLGQGCRKYKKKKINDDEATSVNSALCIRKAQ